jgi:hypothetical protein
MLRLAFECPTTGQPINRMAVEGWDEDAEDTLLAIHCPKCSQLHQFSRADALVEMSGAFTRTPVAATA